MKIRTSKLAHAAIAILFSSALAHAQDVQKNVPYVCNGDRIVIDSCNMRDLSDTSTCMVGHPEVILSNGLMKYTTETRGALKKLLPTCKQPTADQVARAKAFEKRQQDAYNANEKKANDENDAIEARAQQVVTGKKPKTPEEAAINRCITAGRLPATCTGNLLMKGFEGMIGQVASAFGGGAPAPPPTGLYVGGNFIGRGEWRLEFADGGVALRCGGLDFDQYHYDLSLKNNRVAIAVKTNPKSIVFEQHPDGTWSDAAAAVVNGRVQTGSRAISGGGNPGSTYRDSSGNSISQSQADQLTASGGHVTRDGSTYTVNSNAPTYVPTYAAKTVTCSQAVLTSKGAGPSGIDVGTGFLKSMFSDGEKGPEAPAGLRMRGSYGGDGGILLEFFPESAIISCGEAAHAYPYVVRADGNSAVIDLQDPAHTLSFPLMPDGQLNATSGPYEVHGRTIIGTNDNDDFKFAPLNATCNLTTLKAGAAPGHAPAAAAPPSLATGNPANPTLSSPGAPTGNAVLNITSGFPAQPGAANPLAGRPMVILRTDYDSALRAAGLVIPAGTTGQKFVQTTCANRANPDCQKASNAIKAQAASALRGDASGNAALPGVPPGPYYLMISAQYQNQTLQWSFKVDLKPGANNVKLDPSNATPLN
jgi:hypothetical protein